MSFTSRRSNAVFSHRETHKRMHHQMRNQKDEIKEEEEEEEFLRLRLKSTKRMSFDKSPPQNTEEVQITEEEGGSGFLDFTNTDIYNRSFDET